MGMNVEWHILWFFEPYTCLKTKMSVTWGITITGSCAVRVQEELILKYL